MKQKKVIMLLYLYKITKEEILYQSKSALVHEKAVLA